MKILISEHHRDQLIKELFDRETELDVISTHHEDYGTFYHVENGKDIKGDVLVQEMYNRKLIAIHWYWAEGNMNTTPAAWKQMVMYSFRVLKEYVQQNSPFVIVIISKEPQITRIYNSRSFTLLIEKNFGEMFTLETDSKGDLYLITRDLDSIDHPDVIKFLSSINIEGDDDEYS